MKKFNPNKNIIITLILVIIVVVVVSLSVAQRASDKRSPFIQGVLNDTVAFVDKTLTMPFRWVNKQVDTFQNLLDTYDENVELKKKLDDYDELRTKTKNQERELSQLQEELDLQSTLTSFEKITANVITRSPDSWQDFLVVDKGTDDGIAINMAVMSNQGLIGRIIEVNTKSSKVELLTASNQSSNHFPVRIMTKTGDSFGLLKSYDSKTNELIIEQIIGENKIQAGDFVQTSGLGKNSPAGLAVGTVVTEEKDRFGLETQVRVKAQAQMTDISVVTIIQRMVGDGNE